MESNSPNHSLVAMGTDRVSPGPTCDDIAFANPSTFDNNDLLKALETNNRMQKQTQLMQKQTQQLLEQAISKGFSSVPSSSTLPDGPNNPSRDDSMFVVHEDEADGSEKEKSQQTTNKSNQTTAECDIYMDVSSKLKELKMKWANDWDQEIAKNGGGERNGLLIANTYSKRSNDGLKELPRTVTSAEAMKKAFDDGLKDLGKTPISCDIENNLTQNDLISRVEDFARKCNQGKVNTLVFYFAGHGGHESLESDDSVVVEHLPGEDGFTSGNRYKKVGKFPSFFKERGNFIFADPDEKGNCGKISKSHLISIICSETPELKHRIIIFDCCRGDKKETMSSQDVPEAPEFIFDVAYSSLQSLNNAAFKNTYVFHSTLPHQVAYCCVNDLTYFSKYFTKFLGHMDLSCMDVAINAALKHGERDIHIQMIELVKWVDTPFKF